MTRAPFEYHIEFYLHNVEEVAEALRGIAQHGASFAQCKIFIFYFTPLSDKQTWQEAPHHQFDQTCPM